VKVWVMLGEVYGKRDLAPNANVETKQPARLAKRDRRSERPERK
jgi:hypothetical protein